MSIIIAKQYLYIFAIFLSRKLKPSHFIQSLAKKKSGSDRHLNTFRLIIFCLSSVFLTELTVRFQDPVLNLITSSYQAHVICANFGRNSDSSW